MPVATIEFLLTERPVRVEIEFAKGSVLGDILSLIEQKLPCSLKESEAGAGTQENLLSSFVMARNGRIADPGTRLEDGDQIRIFHLLDGG
jgi:sulfur carrier protein ThiS